MKKLISSVLLLITGIIFSRFDGGFLSYVVAYLLLLTGGWQMGEALTNYLLSKDESESDEWPTTMLEIKAKIADITLPLLISVIIELLLVGAEFKIILVVISYLIYVIGYEIYLVMKSLKKEGN